ncbi:MAG: serine/threonine protein kinase [Myxococcales bacterium]|nr:serine/threonine protein kinase [Myxococcales bacterium]
MTRSATLSSAPPMGMMYPRGLSGNSGDGHMQQASQSDAARVRQWTTPGTRLQGRRAPRYAAGPHEGRKMADRSDRRFCPHCGRRTLASACPDDAAQTVALVRFDPRVLLRPGDVVSGRYEIIDTIGKGGYGSIFGARHTATGQEIALKVMRSDFDGESDQQVRRFFREARVTAALQHPNTVRVFDVGQTPGGAFYIAMERLHGPSLEAVLQERLEAGNVMTEAETIDVIAPVLRSLQEAHAHGLVHRDMKPANIVLADFGDGDRTVKVVDFGVAWTGGSALTTTGMAVGTPAYMSPEQCEARDVDGRSDLYSLAIVMYRCLAGDVPFPFDNSVAIMQAHLDSPVPDVRRAARTPVNDAVVATLTRALQKDPEDRWQDARSMREALERGRVRRPAWTPPDVEHPRRASPPPAARQRPAPRHTDAAKAAALPAGVPLDLPDALPDAASVLPQRVGAAVLGVDPRAGLDVHSRPPKQTIVMGGGGVLDLANQLRAALDDKGTP